jgi:hypothetical protein
MSLKRKRPPCAEKLKVQPPQDSFSSARLVADDVGVNASGLLLQILRLKAKPLLIPVLAKLHTGSHKSGTFGVHVLGLQFLFDESLLY